MTTLETLIAARELISVPERWTKGAFARTKAGWAIGPVLENACRFCSLGAIYRVLPIEESVVPAVNALAHAVDGNGFYVVESDAVAQFNDTHTHAEVLAAFDRAIELERSKTP